LISAKRDIQSPAALGPIKVQVEGEELLGDGLTDGESEGDRESDFEGEYEGDGEVLGDLDGE
jgi:hypothetical protein